MKTLFISAWNEAPDLGAEEVTATGTNTAAPISGEEWIPLSGYGEWSSGGSSLGRPIKQVFGQREAESMAQFFNSVVGKVSRFLRGAPIFIGHPDADRTNYPDERRLGKIVALEARPDGLYGKPAWNALGRENLEEGYWVFPSSNWAGKVKGGILYPDRFLSVGLTNTPAGDVGPVTFNASAPGAAEDSQERDSDTPEPTNQEEMDPEIIGALKLEEGSTKEDVLEAISALRAKADGADSMKAEHETAMNAITQERDQLQSALESEKTGRESAENAVRTLQEARRDQLLGKAIESGALSKADAEEKWKPMFEKDYETAANAIGTLKPGSALNTTSIKIGEKKIDVSDSRGRMSAINAAVEERLDEFDGDYDRAFNAVKTDEKTKHLFKGRQGAGEDDEEI